jgi:hypothetical protein
MERPLPVHAPASRQTEKARCAAVTITANADGTVTYVIASTDPGAANWLDTTGYRDGFGILRWQAIPATLTKDGLIREVRIVKLSEVADFRVADGYVSPTPR